MVNNYRVTLLQVAGLLFIGLVGLLTSCKKGSSSSGATQPPPEPSGGGELVVDTARYIGVNYNESLNEIKPEELARSKTKWVRGFLDVFHHYDQQNLQTSPRIVEYLKLKDLGYRTILSLKFNFKSRPYPEANSTEWNQYLLFLDKILERVVSKTDVIIVGNEPFIESGSEAQNEPLNSFYKAAANRVHAFLSGRHLKRPIFLGAFDNMYQGSKQSHTGISNLLAFCKATPWIAGIDVHLHHAEYAELTDALGFVAARIRDDQKIIISEYSLMKWWRSHLNDDLSAEYLLACRRDANDRVEPPPPGVTKVWQYIDYALKNPRSKEEWDAFHQHTPWLEARKDYLCASLKLFASYRKFWIATYAMRQSYPPGADFTAGTDPWVLNSLFTGRSVELMPGGEAQGRYGFLEEFAAINSANQKCY